MDESRNSHRLLRRFALLATIHGVTITAGAAHLHASDHNGPTRSSLTRSSSDSAQLKAAQTGNIYLNPFTQSVPNTQTVPNDLHVFNELEFSNRDFDKVDFDELIYADADPIPDYVPMRLPSATDTIELLPGSGFAGAEGSGAEGNHEPMRLPSVDADRDANRSVAAPGNAADGDRSARWSTMRPIVQKLPSVNSTANHRASSPVQTSTTLPGSTPVRMPSTVSNPTKLPTATLPTATPAHSVATRLSDSEPQTALAAMSQSTPPWIQPHLELPPAAEPVQATMNASKLLDMARESLREAHSRMRRDATHSAHKIASEALELLVAMGDARDGGTERARHLESAMSAVRESRDFWSARGPIDHETLERSIAVHETTVLQQKSLQDMSAFKATSAYLGYAKDQLALAAKSVPEASDALVLLGQIEKRLGSPSDPHASAVALTMHRAAVAVDPNSGYCRRELGKALLHQGLNIEALEELKVANSSYPTRSGFQAMREAALRVGDESLASRCIAAMNDRRLPPDTPVYRLPPEQFAATHRPNVTEMTRANTPSATAATATATKTTNTIDPPTTQVTGKKSWFPFGRR